MDNDQNNKLLRGSLGRYHGPQANEKKVESMARILVIGGGIGGLTSAIALRQRGHDVDVIERDPDWSVYGVGIIQQSNVIRAVAQLGILDDYLDAGCAFDRVDIYIPTGQKVASVPTPKLREDYPANIGIGRPALHKVLGDRTKAAGASVTPRRTDAPAALVRSPSTLCSAGHRSAWA